MIVAVPFMPAFNSRTDNGWPLTVKRKSSGLSAPVAFRQPHVQLSPYTASDLDVLVCVDVDVVCCAATPRP